MTPQQQSEAIRDMLNEAFKLDPAAITALMVNRVPCNSDLADRTPVGVEEQVLPDGPQLYVGALGIISGICRALGIPAVAAAYLAVKDDWVFEGFSVLDSTEQDDALLRD